MSASVTLDSEYRFRGVSLNGSKPSLRLSANFDAASGWYAGASATQATLSRGQRYGQLLGYAGYATSIAAGHGFEFGASYSHFSGDSRYDFAEAYAGILAQRWSLRVNYAPNYFGRHVQTAYVDASAHRPLGSQVRLFGHVGLLMPLARVESGATQAGRARADLRVGAAWALHDLDLQLAWAAATRGGPFPAIFGGRRGAWLASASYAF